MSKPVTWVAVAVLVVGGGFGLYWFEPWQVVVDERVDDQLSDPMPAADPGMAPMDPSMSADPGMAPMEPSMTPVEPSMAAGPVLLAEGEFVSHEHRTTGTARIVRQPDGSHRLELVGLDTSNGPDLRVWLTDQPVIEGRDGWGVFDDGEWTELGELRGNQGDQVYDIPADVDPADYTSVSIWCERFSVSFGAATLTTPPG